jgi:hypothetical protein
MGEGRGNPRVLGCWSSGSISRRRAWRFARALKGYAPCRRASKNESGMKSRTHGAEASWTLDDDTTTVFIPMTWKRRGGQKVIIAPGGGDAWAPAKPRPDETLIRALARAQRWNRMI